MARDSYRKATNVENEAFEKMTAGLRHSIEGATVLGQLQDRGNWTRVAMALQKVLQTTNELYISARARSTGLH